MSFDICRDKCVTNAEATCQYVSVYACLAVTCTCTYWQNASGIFYRATGRHGGGTDTEIRVKHSQFDPGEENGTPAVSSRDSEPSDLSIKSPVL